MYTKHQWNSDKHFNFKYALYLPKDYDETKKYPLVFFLHGAGERGDDAELSCRNGFMQHVRDEGREYPFIYVSPQCPEGKFWACYTESIHAFIDYICDTLPVDRNRICLTGLSMGATGLWTIAMADTSKFCCLAAVCGNSPSWNAHLLKDIPICMYHGDCDDVVPLTGSTNMLKVNRVGGRAKLTILHGVGHNAWDYAYADPELLDWILSQRKDQNTLPTE